MLAEIPVKKTRTVTIEFKSVDQALGNKLFKLSSELGMYPERIAILALYVGLQVVEEQLSGIRLDMDVAGLSLTGKFEG